MDRQMVSMAAVIFIIMALVLYVGITASRCAEKYSADTYSSPCLYKEADDISFYNASNNICIGQPLKNYRRISSAF